MASAAVTALATVVVATTLYEHVALGWHFARENAPENSLWQWLRAVVMAGLSFSAIFAICAATIESIKASPSPKGAIGLGWFVLLGAAALTVVLVASPQSYRTLGAEDGVIEWLSAGALFLGCGLSVVWFINLWKAQQRAPPIHLLAAGGFTALVFVMGMEEISWGQRLLGFETPRESAAGNWQREFNLHNMQTDLSELALYTSTGLFLVILPLVGERLSHWRLVEPFRPLLPDRSVALVSAPMLALTYARWDLLPVQVVFFAGLAACAVYAATAQQAGLRHEARLFLVICIFLPLGQIIHLLVGHRMIYIHDPSEFREAILSIGICWYCWRQAGRARPAPRDRGSHPRPTMD